MQKRKSSNRRPSRGSRRLTTEALESRQLMAADLGMPGSPDLQSAMLSRIQSSGVDVSALVSRFQSSGMSSQQLQAMRQQIAGNPTAQAMVQQRMQAALSQTESMTETTESEQLSQEEVMGSSLDSTPPTEATGSIVDATEQEVVPPSETSPREDVREEVAERVSERFEGEVPLPLQERIAARREGGSTGAPLNRLRAMADRSDVDPSEFVVRDADGAIDREATRENVQERIEDSELAGKIRERLEERFDGEVPEQLQERIAARREEGTTGGPLSRLRDMADRSDVDPSEFVVRDADGAIDREATRENVQERIEGSELAGTVRDRLEERFDGEVPEQLQERIAARREDGASGGPLSRLRAMADRADVDPSEFVVRDADGAVDREATRDNVRDRVEGSELADKIRDRVAERFDGEVPEQLQERIAERIAAGGGDASSDSPESVFASPAVSTLGRSDVNRDGALSPLDALLVINVMNDSASGYNEMADVNADGQITPIDALQIVNAMNDRSAAPAPGLREAAIDHLLAGGLDDDDEEDGIFSLPIRSRMRFRS